MCWKPQGGGKETAAGSSTGNGVNTGHLALGRGGGEASSDEEEEEEENGGEQTGEPLPVPSPRYCSGVRVARNTLESPCKPFKQFWLMDVAVPLTVHDL